MESEVRGKRRHIFGSTAARANPLPCWCVSEATPKPTVNNLPTHVTGRGHLEKGQCLEVGIGKVVLSCHGRVALVLTCRYHLNRTLLGSPIFHSLGVVAPPSVWTMRRGVISSSDEPLNMSCLCQFLYFIFQHQTLFGRATKVMWYQHFLLVWTFHGVGTFRGVGIRLALRASFNRV
ncbi:hypothetical protein VNO80_03677 [Phaseolus coccineus]|uniref:Uncharacterized protein n=1 Tax=Phaseolus coccineus TaxID=3886 RepID=A0AAN9NS21_PHACN